MVSGGFRNFVEARRQSGAEGASFFGARYPETFEHKSFLIKMAFFVTERNVDNICKNTGNSVSSL